jgi:hypothetical protein
MIYQDYGASLEAVTQSTNLFFGADRAVFADAVIQQRARVYSSILVNI